MKTVLPLLLTCCLFNALFTSPLLAKSTILDLDASLYTLTTSTQKLVGTDVPIEGTIQNMGLEAINGFTLSWSVGDDFFEENYTNLMIEPGSTFDFQHSVYYFVEEGPQILTIELTNINGQNDENPNDNQQFIEIEGIVPAPGKMVFAELGTGTWCSWCPRGFVAMDQMLEAYSDYFIGIEIHKDDPMENTDLSAGFNAPTWPIARLDRQGGYVEPLDMEMYFMEQIARSPLATLSTGAIYDPVSRELQVAVTADFAIGLQGDYRLVVLLIENNVQGGQIGYGQANNYAGGAAGPMGGYEDLPLFVPPQSMNYQRVGRALLTDYQGQPNSFPLEIEANQPYTRHFSYTLPETWDMEQLQIVSLLVVPDGSVDNASLATIDQAIHNGFPDETVGTANLEFTAGLSVAPNPFQETVQVSLELSSATTLNIQILDMRGRSISHLIVEADAGPIQHSFSLPGLPEGPYLLRVQAGEQQITKKLMHF